jgi:hypothetical protein
MRLWNAQLLDHGDALDRWARIAWTLCGPVTP